MGALTLKSFPFELRGWDIEKLESIDPTDSFGSNTRIYISKNKIIQIEPDFDTNTANTWLTDKGRQFFDGILNNEYSNNFKSNSWNSVINFLLKTLYISEHCRAQQNSSKFLTIVFENLDLEMLNLLTLISQKHSFIKIRRAENYDVNNNLEANLQLNLANNKAKLQESTLCLLVANNPRYEGYYLNLNLRQRFLKGNFKCFSIGPLTNLTFPTNYLGSSTNALKTIIEGNNLVCQEIKFSSNPILIFNTEFSKRYDGKKITEKLHQIKNSGIFSNCWNGLNVLNPSLNEVGNQLINKFLPVSYKDLKNSSSVYFCNVSANNTQNIKKIIKLKLTNFNTATEKNKCKLLFLDQNSKENSNFETYKNLSCDRKNYFHIPSSMFYEDSKTFINTEGYFKKTTKAVFKNKNKNSWQIFRRVLKHFNNNTITYNNNQTVTFNSRNLSGFRTYNNFHYQATKTLTSLNFYLTLKNESFILSKETSYFKQTRIKTNLTKQKYWLDDFYNGGKDEYSHNSLVLSNCSKLLRTKSANFF